MCAERVIVVGGGVGGCVAALEASKRGLSVTLVDEHPQNLAQMSLDAPYFYGSRLSSVLSDTSAIADRVLGASPLLLDCLDAGVEILTSTIAWGNFVPGPNLTYSGERRLGLADSERSWLASYEYLIIAPGARDLVLSFPGWQLPGVIGAEGASTLLTRYQALGASRVVVLGSGNTGLRLAKRLVSSGCQVVAIVDVASDIRGQPSLGAELKAAGVEFKLSTVIDAALGDREVTAVRLVSLDAGKKPAGNVEVLETDTICVAIGMVPNIELAAQSGCSLEYRMEMGGWVPATDADWRTSIPFIYTIGDGAGFSENQMFDEDKPLQQARQAIDAIVSKRVVASVDSAAKLTLSGAARASTAAEEWASALLAVGGLDVMVCQCEEVTRGEVIGLKAPRYLQAPENRRGGAVSPEDRMRDRTSQDLVKRMTRAGMGHCQGKRCREHVSLLLAHADSRSISEIGPATFRAPVRPLPLGIVTGADESEEISRNWPTWFQPLHEGEIS